MTISCVHIIFISLAATILSPIEQGVRWARGIIQALKLGVSYKLSHSGTVFVIWLKPSKESHRLKLTSGSTLVNHTV